MFQLNTCVIETFVFNFYILMLCLYLILTLIASNNYLWKDIIFKLIIHYVFYSQVWSNLILKERASYCNTGTALLFSRTDQWLFAFHEQFINLLRML